MIPLAGWTPQFQQSSPDHPTSSVSPSHPSKGHFQIPRALFLEMDLLETSDSALMLLRAHHSMFHQQQWDIWSSVNTSISFVGRTWSQQNCHLFAATWLPTSFVTRSPNPSPLKYSSPMVSCPTRPTDPSPMLILTSFAASNGKNWPISCNRAAITVSFSLPRSYVSLSAIPLVIYQIYRLERWSVHIEDSARAGWCSRQYNLQCLGLQATGSVHLRSLPGWKSTPPSRCLGLISPVTVDRF